MSEQETIADIIADMRSHGQQNIDAEKDKPEYGILTVEGRIILSYADHLEAAHKREKAAIEADALAVGGIVKAMRQKEAICTKCRDGEPPEDCRFFGEPDGCGSPTYGHYPQLPMGDVAKLREAISTLRTALKEIRNDVLDMVMNHKSEDPDSYAHGLCLSIGGACDMALNSTKEFDNAGK